MEITLGMVAHRAHLGSFLSYNYMSAIGALPYGVLIPCEDNSLLDFSKEFPVPFLVSLLYSGHTFEKIGDLVETFLPGGNGEAGIHVGPLKILTVGSIRKIDLSCRNRTPMKEFEPDLSMFLLILGSLLEELADLDIAVFLCPGGILSIPYSNKI